MSNTGCLLGALNLFFQLSSKYNRLSQDPERKAKTVYFGVYSIVMCVFTCAFAVLILWGIISCTNSLDSSGLGEIVLYVFIAILALCELVLFLQLIFGGLLGIIYQFRCNRRPISWIALAVFIIVIAGMAVGIFFILGMF